MPHLQNHLYPARFPGKQFTVLYIHEACQYEKASRGLCNRSCSITIEKSGVGDQLGEKALKTIYLSPDGKTVYVIPFYQHRSVASGILNRPLFAYDGVSLIRDFLSEGIFLDKVGCIALQYNALHNENIGEHDLYCTYFGGEYTDIAKVESSQWQAWKTCAIWKIWDLLRSDLERNQKEKIYTLMRDCQPQIASVETKGIYIDTQALQSLYKSSSQKLKKHEKTLQLSTHVDINFNSSKQVSRYLEENIDHDVLATWPKARDGSLKQCHDTLSLYSDLSFVQQLLEYRIEKQHCSQYKRLSKHIRDNRIHATFNLGGCKSGRMTAKEPNIQGISRKGGVRKIFTAPKGRKLIVADYSQIELRVAAHLSQDKAMLEAYREHIDLHRKTAAQVTQKPYSSITDEERQKAKAVNFGMLFGQKEQGLAQSAESCYNVSMTIHEATEAIKAFQKAYPDLAAWQEKTIRRAREAKSVKTWCGRVYYFGDQFSPNQALNIPIQGTAAEILSFALIRLDQELRSSKLDAYVVNIIHDEIIVECSDVDSIHTQKTVIQAMKDGMLQVFPEATCEALVKCGIGQTWADAK
jgi:DNA polymerase I-like protein with 3'-5' exonuclease and polymerase domains